MNIIAIVVTALLSTCFVAQAAEPARIDGSTETSFDASFAKLVRPLKAPERRTLALGLFGALLPHKCLTSEAIIALTFQPVGPKDGPRIRPCREHLHGKSYRDILETGDTPPTAPSAALPNNSFKPNLLRKSA